MRLMLVRACTWGGLLAAGFACSKDAARDPSSLRLLPREQIMRVGDSTIELARALDAARKGKCAPTWPARSTLRGTLQREVHLGPPGYGETPSQDARDTIYVLTLPDSLSVCGDSHAVRRDTSVRIGKVQLVSPPVAVVSNVGQGVSVVGSLQHAAFGWHYLPIFIHVDSIPGLKAQLPVRQASLPHALANAFRELLRKRA